MRQVHMIATLVLLGGACARSTVVNSLEEGAPCLEDADCGEGMRCIEDSCRVVANCQSDVDCHSDQSCANGFCVGNQSCNDSRGCPDDQVCEDATCRRMGDCSSDSDCPDEARCDEGRCRQNPACDGDADCPPEQHCGEAGLCVRNDACLTDADCAITETCEEGVCSRTDACSSDADCPGDQHCGDAGLCERNDRCNQDADCPIDQSCEAGSCTRNPSCVTHDDCPADEACVEGQCLRHAGCRDDSECDNGVFCDGAETCSITDGCQDGAAPVVDDNLDCTQDFCDEDNDEVVHVARHQLCDDGNVCTDDSCDLSAGCLNIPNDANTPAQVDGDCSRAACSNGQLIQTPDDGDLPADDGVACTLASCSGGSVRVEYRHGMCDDHKVCTRDECTAAGCANLNDNSIVPDQTPNQYCLKQICEGGEPKTVPDPNEPPPDNNPNDCVSPACDGSTITTVAANYEVPIGQGDPDPCMKWACVDKSPAQVYDDTAVPPDDAVKNCRKNICSSGVSSIPDLTDLPADVDGDCSQPYCTSSGTVGHAPDLRDAPSDTNAHDCSTPVCNSDGSIGVMSDNSEVPADRTTPGDCLVSICFDGAVVDSIDTGDPPPDLDPTDCSTPVCNSDGSVGAQPDDTETPPQVAGNCQREICSGGGVSSTQDNNDLPDSDGIACTNEICVNGSPQHAPDDSACLANFCEGEAYCDATPQTGGCKTRNPPTCSPSNATCFTGSCDPSAAGGAGACVDEAINVDGDPVAKCGPDGVAGNSNDDCNDNAASMYPGNTEQVDDIDNDCDGYTDEGFVSLTCGSLVQSPDPPKVFDATTITVPVSDPAAGAAPYQLNWSVTTEPLANSLALSNPNSNQVGFTPILYGDYALTLTLSQPDAANQTCSKSFAVAAPDVGINVTMYMSDAADVDLHLMNPYGSNWDGTTSNQDPFSLSTDWGYFDDCYWGNCTMCTVQVPGQGACTINGPLDWDGSGTVVAGNPTLDVDNLRGCYDDANGNRVCTPESISIKAPSLTGPYTVAVHYYGASSDGPEPASIDVVIKVFCRGSATTYEGQYICPPLSVGGWCLVRDIDWGAAGCLGLDPVTLR